MSPVTATVSFTADDSAELGRIFSAIGEALRALETDKGSTSVFAGASPQVDAQPAASPTDWYRDHGPQFVERLRPNALRALRIVVKDGPTVPFQRVRDELDLKGPALAGTLASVGAAVSALGAPEPPFRADHKRQVYTIDPGVQSALRDAVKEERASRVAS
jgi:hypothetical protein